MGSESDLGTVRRRPTQTATAARPVGPGPPPLAQLAKLATRLARCAGRQEVAREALRSVEDLLGVHDAALLRGNGDDQPLIVTAATGRARAQIGMAFEPVAAIVNARNRRVSIMTRATVAGATAGARGVAVPLICGDELRGVLYAEGTRFGVPGDAAVDLLGVVAALTAAALAVCDPAGAAAADGEVAGTGPVRELEFVYYQADDTVLCDSAYVAKGAPGRILWAMLDANARYGRRTFTNRELRLDESLQLPLGRDNLESRLLTLRRRLANIDCGVELERVGRGRLELTLRCPVRMTVVPTSGPMSGAPTPVAAPA